MYTVSHRQTCFSLGSHYSNKAIKYKSYNLKELLFSKVAGWAKSHLQFLQLSVKNNITILVSHKIDWKCQSRWWKTNLLAKNSKHKSELFKKLLNYKVMLLCEGLFKEGKCEHYIHKDKAQ